MSLPLPIRSLATVLALLLLLSSSARGSAAQDPPTAVLDGQVVDSVAGEPIEGVLVRLDVGPEAMTGEDGRFRISGIEPGLRLVALLSADCRVTWSEVTLEPGSVADAVFRLPVMPAAEERRERQERRRSQGTVLTGDEIDAMHVGSLPDVIRRIEPSMVGSVSMVGEVAPIRSRSRNSFTDEGMEPVVVIDGTRAAEGSRALDSMSPSDVARLEVLPGSSAGWEYGSDGAAGVIRVTTRRGSAGAPEVGSDACVVPDFPSG